MKIYLAVGNTPQHIELLKEQNAPNILFSYEYFKKTTWEEMSKNWWPSSLIVDSGAFTVWNKGSTIDIDKYLEFSLSFKNRVPETTNVYFVNLDVLPGKFGKLPTKEQREQSAKQGWNNMEYLESNGLKIIPVFHQHEDLKWLEKMMEIKKYIGISPANDVSTKKKKNG